MRALFVGGAVDNSELDMESAKGAPPKHYPENGGGGRPRYNLHHVGQRNGGEIAYAVYAAPEMAKEDVIEQETRLRTLNRYRKRRRRQCDCQGNCE